MNRRPLRNCESLIVNGVLMTVGFARGKGLLNTAEIALPSGKAVLIRYDNVYEILDSDISKTD